MDRTPLLPNRGATNGTSFKGTPADMAPYQAIRNYRAQGTRTDRPRGGKRPGLKLTFARQLKNAAVQAVASITRATGTSGFSLGTCAPLETVVSSPAAALVGNLGALDDVPSMDWFAYIDVTGAGGPTNNTVNAVAYDPDGEFVVATTNYLVSGVIRTRVVRFNLIGGQVWSTEYPFHTANVAANTLAVTKFYTIVAMANSGGQAYVAVYRNDTGAFVQQTNIEGWANEAVCVARWLDPVTGLEYVYIAFDGRTSAGTYTGGIGSGVIKFGRWARDFRSGIVKYRVAQDYASPGSALSKVQWGTALQAGGAYFEALHGTWRLSEHTPYRPHGGRFTGLAVGVDGSVYFSKRNNGWGPNDGSASFKPDGLTEAYRTVGKITAAGVLSWMQDTDSIRELDDLGNYNDFLGLPSLQALTVDADGNVYVGGRINAAGGNVFALSTAGTPMWSTFLTGAAGTIREGAAAFDATDNSVLFAGDRNTLWAGASGAPAFLWKLDRSNGDVIWGWDMNENVSGLAVAASGAGKVWFGCDKV